ncbi:MAG: hypothetical protein ACJ74W_20175 [Pyrinomonadaceae bacterium]
MLGKLQNLQGRHLPRWVREGLIFVGFLALTALMTWPWVTRMRDAVADNGDSYAFAWSLWWNYHQTFTDPLNLFHANIFFPYRYTLAFTEHGYGAALCFFPLFAVGLRPLTVYSVATFCTFAFSGYGMFRLARTLTGSSGTAWVAGIIFAFIPYHFIFLTALPYLFTMWLPLLLEALVLFVRVHSWRRAAWLGVACLMSGLTCINWLLLSLVPFVLSGALLVVRHRLQRDRAFWLRGLLALVVGALLLLPFVWPYYMASKLYGFKRDAAEVTQNSAGLVDWLTARGFNRVWLDMGRNLPNVKATLFPGLLPLLLALAALLLVNHGARRTPQPFTDEAHDDSTRKRWLYALDALCVVAGCVALVAAGYAGAPAGTWAGALFPAGTADRALLVLTVAFIARLSIAYPPLLRRGASHNLIESLRAERRSDAFWLGVIWAGAGFLGSFGMSFYLYRVLFDLLLPLQSIRAPYRAGMTAYVGLALLAALGAQRLTQLAARWRPFTKPHLVYALLVGALLFELHAAPLAFIRGAVFPDAVTLRLKELRMRGGVLDLPSLPEAPYYSFHLAMLRAADHGHPVVFAAASFIPPLTIKVHELSNAPELSKELLDLFEQLPVSYVVVHRPLLKPARAQAFATFFADGVAAGRLRLVGSYDSADLYAVTKTEPEAH